MFNSVLICSDGPLNNTVGELNARNRYSGGLFDVSADNSLITSRDITADGHHRAEDSSSEPDDQSSCLVSLVQLDVSATKLWNFTSNILSFFSRFAVYSRFRANFLLHIQIHTITITLIVQCFGK